MDELLSQIPNPDDIQVEPRELELQDGVVCSETSNASVISTRFGNPVVNYEVKGAAVPANTQKSTTWAVKVWSGNHRLASPSDWSPHAQDGSSTMALQMFWK